MSNESSIYDIIPKQMELNDNEEKVNGINDCDISMNMKRLLELEWWYHGMVTRRYAESLLRFDGDFLVSIL